VTTRLSDLDRESLLSWSTTDWHTAPLCFRPNELFFSQVQRGLVQFTQHKGRYLVRVTELGFQLARCRGEA
jgi:hypothetical protein